MVGVIVYKLLVIHPLYKNPDFQEYAATIVSVTGSLMNLIIIMILSKVRFVFKSVYKPGNPWGRSLSPLSIAWMDYAIPSQGIPPSILIHRYLFLHLVGKMSIKCLAEEHNTLYPARARSRLIDGHGNLISFANEHWFVFKRSFTLKE